MLKGINCLPDTKRALLRVFRTLNEHTTGFDTPTFVRLVAKIMFSKIHSDTYQLTLKTQKYLQSNSGTKLPVDQWMAL